MTSQTQALSSPTSTIRTFQPQELHVLVRETLSDSSSSSPLWNIILPRRLSSIAAEEGIWLANDTTSCIVQVIPRINLFHRGVGSEEQDARRDTIQAILQNAVQILVEAEKDSTERPDVSQCRLTLAFGSLDRKILPLVRTTLEEGQLMQRKFFTTYTSHCGMWVYEATTKHQTADELNKDLPPGVTVRPLRQDDAELVNERWEYKSGSSLQMIRKMISVSEESFGGCVGLVVDDRLVSWVCRYLDGTIGMLFTESDYRKKGYAALVLMAAVFDVRRMSQKQHRNINGDIGPSNTDGRVVSYIVDSNNVSLSLYRQLGWRRVADADWFGFASRKISQ
jgi:GNAT superfamily N-acetyltransferase